MPESMFFLLLEPLKKAILFSELFIWVFNLTSLLIVKYARKERKEREDTKRERKIEDTERERER